MKYLKLFCSILLVSCCLFSSAQTVNVEVIKKVALEMAEKLQLDEVKKAALANEMQNTVSKIEDLQNSEEKTDEDKSFEIVKILKQEDVNIQSLLSPSEYATFKQLQTQLKSDRLKGVNGDDKVQEVLSLLKTTLSLSDEKSQKLGEVLIAHETEKRNIKVENEGNIVAIRNQIKTLNQKTNIEIKSFLTEEEYTEYLQLIMKVNQDR